MSVVEASLADPTPGGDPDDPAQEIGLADPSGQVDVAGDGFGCCRLIAVPEHHVAVVGRSHLLEREIVGLRHLQRSTEQDGSLGVSPDLGEGGATGDQGADQPGEVLVVLSRTCCQIGEPGGLTVVGPSKHMGPRQGRHDIGLGLRLRPSDGGGGLGEFLHSPLRRQCIVQRCPEDGERRRLHLWVTTRPCRFEGGESVHDGGVPPLGDGASGHRRQTGRLCHLDIGVAELD